ncbi:MAG: HD domain-containing phosphohydrolase [Candidatus Omnitrophota bacterium]|nr:HD domain-containing protein [Candidatus Omnitrophota bacterium]
MRLSKDLYTIYGQLLAKKDREITHDVVKKIWSMGDKHNQARVPLQNTDIFTDLQKVFRDKRYMTMFKPPLSREEICEVAGRLKLENDIIFELSIMKNNLLYTYYHVLVVAAFVIKLSLAFKPKEYDREIASHCGFTHDIGKTRVPIEILNKRDKLSDEERAIIETHPVCGFLLLNYYLKKDRRECSFSCLEHHRKLDGSGYPKSSSKIHKYTKLISPVDIMDALMTKRPYRGKAFSLRASLDYLIKESREGRIDREIVLMLISFARKNKPKAGDIRISEIPREKIPEEMTHDKYR